MHVLIVSDVYRPGIGGVQTAIDTLTTGLVAAGDSVTVMTGSPKGRVAPCEEQDGKVTVVRLPAVKWPANPDNNRVCFFPAKHVRNYFATHDDPDVIHFH